MTNFDLVSYTYYFKYKLTIHALLKLLTSTRASYKLHTLNLQGRNAHTYQAYIRYIQVKITYILPFNQLTAFSRRIFLFDDRIRLNT